MNIEHICSFCGTYETGTMEGSIAVDEIIHRYKKFKAGDRGVIEFVQNGVCESHGFYTEWGWREPNGNWQTTELYKTDGDPKREIRFSVQVTPNGDASLYYFRWGKDTFNYFNMADSFGWSCVTKFDKTFQNCPPTA